MGLYFFSGKGGVGKTHLSTSFAFSRADVGKRVLLVEFSQSAQYSEYFNREVGFIPVELEKNLFLSSWTGKDCLREYVGKILRSQKASDFFMQIPLMAKLINVAPGLKEIAVLGKLTSDYREIDFQTEFDDIIFDCPSSGHFVSLLSIPKSLGEIVGVGPMKKQCSDILACLRDSEDVHFALIDDGSKFSVKERKETEEKLNTVLAGKNISQIHNFSDELVSCQRETWIETAKSLNSYWKTFQWT